MNSVYRSTDCSLCHQKFPDVPFAKSGVPIDYLQNLRKFEEESRKTSIVVDCPPIQVAGIISTPGLEKRGGEQEGPEMCDGTGREAEASCRLDGETIIIPRDPIDVRTVAAYESGYSEGLAAGRAESEQGWHSLHQQQIAAWRQSSVHDWCHKHGRVVVPYEPCEKCEGENIRDQSAYAEGLADGRAEAVERLNQLRKVKEKSFRLAGSVYLSGVMDGIDAAIAEMKK